MTHRGRRVCHAHCPRGGGWAPPGGAIIVVIIAALLFIAHPLLGLALHALAMLIIMAAIGVTMAITGYLAWGIFAVAAAVRRADRRGLRLPRPVSRPAVPPHHGGWQIMEAGHDWTPIEGQVIEAEVIPAGRDGVAH